MVYGREYIPKYKFEISALFFLLACIQKLREFSMLMNDTYIISIKKQKNVIFTNSVRTYIQSFLYADEILKAILIHS